MTLPENQLPQFHYVPMGLAGHAGQLNLSPLADPTEDSWVAGRGDSASLAVPCTNLESLMQQNGHVHIDLLKLDIEGCEYEVIDDLLMRRLQVRQLAVEFHHGVLPGFRRSQTIRSMLRLIGRGYRLVNQTGANHTFVRAGR